MFGLPPPFPESQPPIAHGSCFLFPFISSLFCRSIKTNAFLMGAQTDGSQGRKEEKKQEKKRGEMTMLSEKGFADIWTRKN